ncbi:SAM-dependent methyltransferase [Rugosimonospora acidiphila]|uniref:SAM-dependent methyltransferase n=1 Tax=Rugosimonospora acidiphila TaxID=556531 RepID=UPI0031EC80A9
MDLKTHIPHPARIYDYLLGGKDNFQADRDAANTIVKDWPTLPASMRANRSFMHRVARFMSADLGMRQFLDVGTGLPTSPNLHEIVQGIAPESRVVYADNDPIVLVHARALLTSTEQGRTAYIDADLNDPWRILGSPDLTDTLDISQPVAVSLLAILHYVTDDDLARHIIGTLMEPLAPGSVLTLSTATVDTVPRTFQGMTVANQEGITSRARTKVEVESLFDGLDLIEPGVALVHRWRPDPDADPLDDSQVQMYCGVAVKRPSA